MLRSIGAVATKEFWGLLREPQLLVLLLVGPVLIMVTFGLSLDVENILRPRALVVVEPGSEGAKLFRQYREEFTDRTRFIGTTDDPVVARQRLLRGEVDAVIIVPSDPLETVSEGQRTILRVIYNTINPVFGTRVPSRAYSLVLDLNQSLVQDAIAQQLDGVRSLQERLARLSRGLETADAAAETLTSEGAKTTTAGLEETLATLEGMLSLWQDARPGEDEDVAAALQEIDRAQQSLGEVRKAQQAGAEQIRQSSGVVDLRESVAALEEALASLPSDVPARVLTNPFELKTQNLASPPRVVGFYAPAVLALLIQHIAVSLGSLAIVRERLSGAYEYFEVSPLGHGQLLAGKLLAYFGLVLGVNLSVALVLASFLGIPVEGGFVEMALAMVLLTGASLGLGFLISALVKSELQAVQVSMLLLIGSGFFAGFLFPLDQMQGPSVAVSYLLPATYGISALQDVMIRGEGISSLDFVGLLLITSGALASARYLMARKMA